MNLVMRQEMKYLIAVCDFMGKSGELRRTLCEDSHNGASGYLIRSLYFDTPFDDDYYGKQSPDRWQQKIRLRVYDPDSDYAMLEMKQKRGSQQRKRSLKVGREDALKLIRCDYAPLLGYEDPFAAELYAVMQTRCYRPCTVVQYTRSAFAARENPVRVTFDNRIEATQSCFDLFCPGLNLNPVLDPGSVVLEVKYDGVLLECIRSMMEGFEKRELPVSKYVMARRNACQMK